MYTSLFDNNDDIEEDGDDDVDSSGCVCDQLDLESLSGPAPQTILHHQHYILNFSMKTN